MTSTMEHPPISDEAVAKLRQQFADDWKEMLEDMAMHTMCTCGTPSKTAQHDMTCPVDVFRRAARAVWLRGERA